MKKIKTFEDLPEYGKFVLVKGVDEKQYGVENFHVCEMNDLEDGMDYKEKGIFYWLTENGTEISNVKEWSYLPK